MALDVAGFKQVQRRVWSSGDYPDIARYIESAAERVVAAAGVEPGQDVLDVATGSGNVAILCAQRGAKVMYRPDGTLRPAGERAMAAFNAEAGEGSELALEPDLIRPRAEIATGIGDWTLALYLGYAFVFVTGLLGSAVLVMTRRGGRAVGRAR